MTAQLLASELANLIQESKRKHNDLRQVSWLSYAHAALALSTQPSRSWGHLILLRIIGKTDHKKGY